MASQFIVISLHQSLTMELICALTLRLFFIGRLYGNLYSFMSQLARDVSRVFRNLLDCCNK